jgi:acyl-CoA thioesterase-1
MHDLSVRLPLAVAIVSMAVTAFAQDPQPAEPTRPNPLAGIEDVEGLPRVLLIGDSISIGYTLGVRDLLEGKANVHRPPENGGPTTNGLAKLDRWLGDKPWDVIHFNWGLHDLKYVGPDGKGLRDPQDPSNHPQVAIEDYEANLRKLVERLRATGAVLIWRNTTPVPPGSQGRVVGDAARYNEAAARVMADYQIPTDDLYGFVQPQIDQIMLPANVHFTREGYAALARQVADAIAARLEPSTASD